MTVVVKLPSLADELEGEYTIHPDRRLVRQLLEAQQLAESRHDRIKELEQLVRNESTARRRAESVLADVTRAVDEDVAELIRQRDQLIVDLSAARDRLRDVEHERDELAEALLLFDEAGS